MMKLFRSIVFSASLVVLFSFGTVLSSNLYLLNLTGHKLLLEVKRIPWGLLFPFSTKSVAAEHKGKAEVKAYRLKSVEIKIPSMRNVRLASNNTGDPVRDERLDVECNKFKMFNKKEACVPGGEWPYGRDRKLYGKVSGSTLVFNQGAAYYNFIPVVLVATLRGNEILITRIAGEKGLAGTPLRGFGPGEFYHYLSGVNLPSWKDWNKKKQKAK